MSISKRFTCALVALVALAAATPAFAQQTTGTLTGRIVDEQGAALPGATVIGKNTGTGFTRASTSDAEGLYRLTALPVGTYDLTIELSGFSKHEQKGIILNVAQTLDVNVALKLATVQETVTVTGESPIIEASSSSVGGVVDVRRIENIPLNGRQFANLAATIPGVMLGYHSDPTKSTQYSPQIGGGNGRNVNYQIDGGDNNDDTVGGLLQLFPLEAIQEFNFVTSRYKAEYGRSNGGVMNIVTKSGTNDLHASWFTFLRDDTMNAITTTEEDAGADKQDYRRYQYGGSVGGPIVTDKVHYFAAYERTQQDTFQVVNTQGLFPNLDGTFSTPYRENLFTAKGTFNMNPAHYLSVRYGRNANTQPYGAGPTSPPSNWGTSENTFNSINANYNWVVSGSMLNEVIFQYADFRNHIGANSNDPTQNFPNGVSIGQNGNTPQTTEQKKYQFRNDFSWHRAGWGVGHDFKVGFNYIHEPRLFITFNVATGDFTYNHLTDDVNGPLGSVTRNGGAAEANIPLDQYAFYVQDDWRVTPRITVNVGLRYDYIDGIQVDQSLNPNYVKVQAAGAAGLLAGIKGMENFGQSPQEDGDNWQPRIGFAWDLRGDGKDIIRGGWGVYQDVGYTNANVLFPAIDATGIGSGSVFSVEEPDGIRNENGTFFQVGQPVGNIASQNQANPNALPLIGQWLDPLLEMPYTRQTAFGWSHQLMNNTVLTVDFVRNDGRDLNTRPRLNTRPVGQPTAPRRLAFLNLQPNAAGTRAATSFGESQYTALILGFKRRMTNGLDFTATYTLGEAKSTVGTAADELNSNNLQEAELLYDDPRVFGPTSRTDARHSGTVAAVWTVKGFAVSPFYIFRSPLPVSTTRGVDFNRNGENNDLPERAYQFDGVGNPPKDIGACETWNCSRGAWRSQFNLRVSYGFRLYANARIEAIGEVFNLLNAKNPSSFTTSQLSSSFMQPQEYSGDFQNPEQRVGQIGFRFSF